VQQHATRYEKQGMETATSTGSQWGSKGGSPQCAPPAQCPLLGEYGRRQRLPQQKKGKREKRGRHSPTNTSDHTGPPHPPPTSKTPSLVHQLKRPALSQSWGSHQWQHRSLRCSSRSPYRMALLSPIPCTPRSRRIDRTACALPLPLATGLQQTQAWHLARMALPCMR
jgi:hypothetical protein